MNRGPRCTEVLIHSFSKHTVSSVHWWGCSKTDTSVLVPTLSCPMQEPHGLIVHMCSEIQSCRPW
jgi:hypothetical protein